MTPEEREQLRRDLEAAGCPWLASAVGDFLGKTYITELRSLLRREVWVATWLEPDTSNEFGHADSWTAKSRVFSSRQVLIDTMSLAGKREGGFGFEKVTIDAELPDGE